MEPDLLGRPVSYRSKHRRRRGNLSMMIVFFLTIIVIFGTAALVH